MDINENALQHVVLLLLMHFYIQETKYTLQTWNRKKNF